MANPGLEGATPMALGGGHCATLLGCNLAPLRTSFAGCAKGLRGRGVSFSLGGMKLFTMLWVRCVIACLFAMTGGAQAERILFIGNSYTGVNNLPKLYQQMVTSGGAVAEVSAVTPGGRTLEQHLSEAKTLQLMDAGKWDVVVIQGQSQEAAMAQVSDRMKASFLKGAKGLCDRIKVKSPTAKIVFYQTWARHADYWKNAKADLNVGKSAEEMQQRNEKSYLEAAKQCPGALVAPVGEAWELNYGVPKSVRLHSGDHSHPALQGSYLAAVVIYATIHPTAKLKVSFNAGLSAAEVAYLQSLAEKICRKVK